MEYYHWEVSLYEDIPTPEKVLQDQINGKRCLTSITSEKLLSDAILNERDGLSFFIHDLEHAFNYFQSPELFQSMRGFYLYMKQLRTLNITKRLLKIHRQFKNQFHYAESDMNAYGPHLFKFLVGAYKKHFSDFTPSDLQELHFSHPILGPLFLENFHRILTIQDEECIQNNLINLSIQNPIQKFSNLLREL